MAVYKALKPVGSAPSDKEVADYYKQFDSTQYPKLAKDNATGQIYRSTGVNSRTIIPEMYLTSKTILENGSATDTTNTIYSVPTGKVFFMLGCNLQVSHQALSTGQTGDFRINGGGFVNRDILSGNGNTTAGSYALSHNFVAIMVFIAGTQFIIRSTDPTITASGNLTGYEIDASEYNPAQ